MVPNQFGEGGAPDIAPPEPEQDDISAGSVARPPQPYCTGLNAPQGNQIAHGRRGRRRSLQLLAILIVSLLVITAVFSGLGQSFGDGLASTLGMKSDQGYLGAPSLFSPGEGEEVVTQHPSLVWVPSLGASGYQVMVSSDPLFHDPLTIPAAQNRVTLARQLDEDSTYYWKVRAVSGPASGDWSETWHFVVNSAIPAPTVASPFTGYQSVSSVPLIQWYPVSGADMYRLQIGGDEAFSSLLFDLIVDKTSYSPPLDPWTDATYYWRVMAHHASVWSPWGQTSEFSVKAHLGTPMPMTPAHNSVFVDTTPTLSWSPVAGADYYRVQVSTSSSFGTVLESSISTSASYTPLLHLSENTTYYWRVQACHGGTSSEWGPVRSFFEGVTIFHMTYQWSYGGYRWTMAQDIPGADYYRYRGLTRNYDYGSYVLSHDRWVEQVASELNDAANSKGWNYYQKIEFVLKFVQYFPYGYDEDTTGLLEYPRYPVETLVDRVSDCEDHAALFVSLIQSSAFNMDAVLVVFPGHMGAAVAGGDHSGYYYDYNGKHYYYCEATTSAPSYYTVGVMPDELKTVGAMIIDC